VFKELKLLPLPSKTVRKLSKDSGYPRVEPWVNEATAEFYRRFSLHAVNLEALRRVVCSSAWTRKQALAILSRPPTGGVYVSMKMPGRECIDVQAILDRLIEDVQIPKPCSIER
jgi:hypothetical protein